MTRWEKGGGGVNNKGKACWTNARLQLGEEQDDVKQKNRRGGISTTPPVETKEDCVQRGWGPEKRLKMQLFAKN